MTAAGDSIPGTNFDHANNPPHAIALRTTNQALTSGVAATITFDSEEFDNAAMFTPSSTTLTVPEDGTYDVSITITFASNTTGSRGVQTNKNGATVHGNYVPATSAPTNMSVTHSNSYLCTAGDTWTFNGFQSSGGGLNVIEARASVRRVSGTP